MPAYVRCVCQSAEWEVEVMQEGLLECDSHLGGVGQLFGARVDSDLKAELAARAKRFSVVGASSWRAAAVGLSTVMSGVWDVPSRVCAWWAVVRLARWALRGWRTNGGRERLMFRFDRLAGCFGANEFRLCPR
ncbi:hypothetical protein FGB62_12g256 [Gracilaria domingensis]|nr:hypothetical protein FGB62_12g256 [Gracilaria domingensis]